MNIWATLIILMSFPGAALAEDAAPKHFDRRMEFKRGVVFEHALHTNTYGFDCLSCHETMAGGKINDFGEAWGHKVCLGCHDALKWAPTICEGCHDRGIRSSKWQLFVDSIKSIFN